MNSNKTIATLFGQMNCSIIGRVIFFCFLFSLLAGSAEAEIVKAENYRAFWLWAGVQPQPALSHAEEIYLLAGEIKGDKSPRIFSQRSATPHLTGPKVWLVYRAQTIAWNDAIIDEILRHIKTWQSAGNKIQGLQIDFDAGTQHLEHYASFLAMVRARLPQQYHLGITGLLDWSANGNPKGLQALVGVVDEVVLQIYQTRHVIPGYQAYLEKLDGLNVPFKIGLLQGGDWIAPDHLRENPKFKGYVVFLLNAKP